MPEPLQSILLVLGIASVLTIIGSLGRWLVDRSMGRCKIHQWEPLTFKWDEDDFGYPHMYSVTRCTVCAKERWERVDA